MTTTPIRRQSCLLALLLLGAGVTGAVLAAQDPGATAVNERVFTVALDDTTGRATAPPVRANASNQERERVPTWSPDGRELAFKTVSAGDDELFGVVVVVNGATGDTRSLRPDLPRAGGRGGMPGSMSWARDGRSLLVDGGLLPGGALPKGAYSVSLDDGRVTRIIAKPQGTVSVTDTRWLLDGRSIVYVQSQKSVVVHDTQTGAERTIYTSADAQGALMSLALAPDGRSVAFCDAARRRLVVVDLASGTPRDLVGISSVRPAPVSVAWSSDGRFVVYSDSVDQTRWDVWRVSAAGGQPESIGVSSTSPIAEPAVRPDGRMLAIVMWEAR